MSHFSLSRFMVFVSLQFFTGPSMNVEGMVGMLNYRPDGVTPYMLFFKDGVISEKCVSTWQNLKTKARHVVSCVLLHYCLKFSYSKPSLVSNKMANPNFWSSGICYLELRHKILRRKDIAGLMNGL